MEDMRELVADVLREHGHHVIAVSDGASAIAALTAMHFEVALIDIALPDINGYAVARRIRELLARRPLHLIAVTGFGAETDRAAALEAGFDDHLVKPVGIATLLEAIDKSV